MSTQRHELHREPETERAIIGAALLDPGCCDAALAVLRPTDFALSRHQLVWDAVASLSAAGEPVDTLAVRSRLERKGVLGAVGDEYLVELGNTIPSFASVEHSARRVRDLAELRESVRRLRMALSEAEEPIESPTDFVSRVAASLGSVHEQRGAHASAPLDEVLDQALLDLDRRAERGQRILGTRTGFTMLDDQLSGICPGLLYVVAGRPGMGKTAFGMALLEGVVTYSRRPGLFCSLEMPRSELASRMIAAAADVDGNRMRAANYSRAEREEIRAKVARELRGLPIDIVDTPAMTLHDVRMHARRVKRERGDLALVVVDYLQLMRAGGKSESREQDISEISRGLKQLAKEEHAAVIALSQLNRGVELRQDKRPQLSDLRESGAIEQDADTVLFVYRDEVYNRGSEDRGKAEIIIGKQRSGPTGRVTLAFDKSSTRFDSLDPRDTGAAFAEQKEMAL